MEMQFLDNLSLGFGVAFQWVNLLYCLIGVLLGTLIGVLPGIGPTATIAMLLPVTFGLSPITAMIMLAGIYYGAQYGGSTTSILVNIPGEAASVVTCLDGYQMARQGRAGPALAASAIGSFFAGCVATVIVAMFAPPLAGMALKFGPAEYFSLMVLGLVAAIVLAHGSLLKAIAMVLLGLLLGLVGTDISSGMMRFTLGIYELCDGIGFVGLAMGLFGIAEVISNLELKGSREVFTRKIGRLMPSREDFRRMWKTILRGTALGSALGILPGGGPLLASFSAYALEKKISGHGDEFGKGAIEGVAGPESANNAGAQTSFIPLLTLGIPSNVVMALMIGALMIQGIIPGPRVIDREARTVLGADGLDVDRQRDARDPEPAADRHLGQVADGSLPLSLPVDPGFHGDRRLRPFEQPVRCAADGDFRDSRRHLHQARVRAGAVDPGLRPRADDGGEPAAGAADRPGRSDGPDHQAPQRRISDRGGHPAGHRPGAGDPQEARGGLRGRLERNMECGIWNM